MTTPRRESAGPLRVAGFRARTTNAAEMTGQGAIGGLWAEFANRAKECPGERGPVAVYHDYESDHNGEYSLLVGIPMENGEAAPDGWEEVTVPAREYLVFPVVGDEMPGAIVTAWMGIWSYFDSPEAAQQRAFTEDFERYGEPNEIFIAIKE